MPKLLYEDITFDIRGACFSVWKNFGGTFKEKVVERALAIDLRNRGRTVETQKHINIYYQGQKVGTYVPDIIVDETVLVEVKCKEFITAQDYDQFWKYLKGSEYKLGLLINFAPTGLEIKRVVYEQARSEVYPRKQSALSQRGFTLMEIIVATTIFAVVMAALMSLFNYTLKINRRSEALRQATQGMRSFVEFLAKEVRNGQIDYGITNGQTASSGFGCPGTPPTVTADSGRPGYNLIGSTYAARDNRLGIITTEGDEECVYLGFGSGAVIPNPNYVGAGVFARNTTAGASYNPNPVLVLKKNGAEQIINPPNYRIDNLMFFIRPICDPSSPDCVDYGSGYPQTQPVVTMFIKFVVQLGTGEQVPIYYQTSVSPQKYDIPNQ